MADDLECSAPSTDTEGGERRRFLRNAGLAVGDDSRTSRTAVRHPSPRHPWTHVPDR